MANQEGSLLPGMTAVAQEEGGSQDIQNQLHDKQRIQQFFGV